MERIVADVANACTCHWTADIIDAGIVMTHTEGAVSEMDCLRCKKRIVPQESRNVDYVDQEGPDGKIGVNVIYYCSSCWSVITKYKRLKQIEDVIASHQKSVKELELEAANIWQKLKVAGEVREL